MNRDKYYKYISYKLSSLSTMIKSNGSLNLFDINIHSENFYRDLFNIIFDYNLKNGNYSKHNVSGIDLIDEEKKIVVQVSSSATKNKIESSLAKLNAYSGYYFKFISITNDGENLIGKNYTNIHNLSFDSNNDIYNIARILREIQNLNIDKLEKVYSLIRKELNIEADPIKTETNLARIINILADIDWKKHINKKTLNFNIDEKILCNKLVQSEKIINEYKIYCNKLNKIYSEFDKEGKNKSISVLNALQYEYLCLSSKYTDDKLFAEIIDSISEKVRNSLNYSEIPYEELLMCVEIIVVDAFIRCKIFENPSEFYVNSR